jgi:hypothetical protein
LALLHSFAQVCVNNAPAQALYQKMAYQPTDIPRYSVTWNYLDETTGAAKENGPVANWALDLKMG